ncbi:SpaA isopeptide-forming pilin-related protein [uncultured Eubacterium sp.]|uniref:SpaA isopeptide-forming pilin-related protein n=1 Tax=uncultured Eubacterium sp. TaxID=165185 RepID=UPI0025FA05B1|nr:SpaA isopeptide-forming pilin-related protein [uncultured Eubacterium sp.]
MKHTKKKKLLAFVLCMVLVLSTAITAFAVDGNFYYVPKDTVELSHEIMKDGASQGTLYATVPGGAFKSSTDNAELQMDMQEETSESTVLEAVRTELENTGNTGYTVHQAVMGDVSFRVSTEDKAQIPEKAVNFRFENTSLDTAHAMGFVYDSSDETITLYELKEDTLQFEEDVQLEAETVVVGCFDVVEKETEEAQPEDEDESVQPVDVSASGYSITTSATNGVDITVQHYLEDGEAPLYKESKVHLSNDQKIENLSSLTNYEAVKVVEVNDGVASTDPISGNIILTTNKTYRVYYRATTGTITKSPVQMFDYTINEKDKGINSSKNYGNNIPTTSRLASGTIGDGCNDYDTNISVSGKSPYYINAWDRDSKGNPVNRDSGHTYGSNTGGTAFAAKGIITGIEYDSGALKMGKTSDNAPLYEPGYFTREAKEGKSIYPDRYKLTFNRNGDNYTLYDVTNTEGTTSKLSNYDRTTGANFFPLDDLGTDKDNKNTAASDGKKHNDYFGMRYDVQFTLGGYLGDLKYHFKGDDDLWVVLDAEKNGGQVVLDIGGIHAAIEDSVDLWQILLKKTDYTLQDKIEYLEADADKNGIKNKDENHTLTILYMERGANDSNCKMDFTLPNSTVIDTSRLETSSLKLTKVNTSGKVISGAKFSVTNDSNQNDTRTVTSGTDGKLTFTGLKEGFTYTLSEVSVPSPYVATTTTWKVKLEGSPLRAVLYDSTGTVAQTIDATDSTYHIVNSTQEDIVSQSVESNKTVSVKDYNARTYQVDLTASSKATQTVTKTTPYDIVMVLDTSGSMSYDLNKYTEYKGTLTPEYDYYDDYENKYFVKTDNKIYQSLNYSSKRKYWYYKDAKSNTVKVTQGGSTKIYTRTSDGTKMAALQNAAKAFVSNVEQKNPDSRISIVSFSGSASIKTDGDWSNEKYLLRVGDSKATIDSWIDNLRANGATNTADGFDKAKDVFSSSEGWADVNQTAGRKKMVVFLTDGVPTTSNTYSDTVANKAVTSASDIKRDYRADIYSLGIFDAADSDGELSGASIAKINTFMTNVASAESKYMTADSINSLYDIFNSITENMPNSVTATITDVIDSRFELTDKQKDTFAKRSDVQVTYNDDGTTTVTWIDTTVNSKTGNTPGWHETIEIKAKDDFIGGNMIPTNGPDSGITVGNNKKSFPQPSVNVMLLTPSIGDKEITYYKGDTIESSKFSGELLGTYKMTELDGQTAVGIPQLTTEQLAELEKGGTVEVLYSYTKSSADVVGKFVYMYRNTKYEAEGTKVNSLEDHTATKVGQDVEEYKLTVTFVPKTVEERKDLLKDTAVLEPDANTSISGTVVTNASKTGTYKVHVLALWAIVKQSTSADSEENHPMLSGAKFELLKDGKVCYTGESKSDGFVEWYKDGTKVSLSEMEKDTYTLRETSAPAGYAKSEVQWTIEITATSVTIKGANGNNITPTQLQNTGKTYDAYVYENTPVYALPSTGGTGIFLYMIGGMLLMGAAAWILYKNKRREVLKR